MSAPVLPAKTCPICRVSFVVTRPNRIYCSRSCFRKSRPQSPEYKAWAHMKGRCFNPRDSFYYRYGARGITVCARWRDSFDAFFRDMGPKPSSRHSLDRINNDGNYEPSNCRWATAREQGHNRSDVWRFVTIDGEYLTLSALANALATNIGTLRRALIFSGVVDMPHYRYCRKKVA